MLLVINICFTHQSLIFSPFLWQASQCLYDSARRLSAWQPWHWANRRSTACFWCFVSSSTSKTPNKAPEKLLSWLETAYLLSSHVVFYPACYMSVFSTAFRGLQHAKQLPFDITGSLPGFMNVKRKCWSTIFWFIVCFLFLFFVFYCPCRKQVSLSDWISEFQHIYIFPFSLLQDNNQALCCQEVFLRFHFVLI